MLPLRTTLALALLAFPASTQVVQLAKFSGSTTNAADLYGVSVDLEGGRALVGSPSNGDQASTAGAAFVHERGANGAWTEAAVLYASDAVQSAALGQSVSLSGDRALVGATFANGLATDSGAAYVYERQPDGSWVEVAKLTASDGANSDRFGFSVALDGDIALVGAWRDDSAGSITGAAYTFERQPDGSWVQTDKLTANDADSLAAFGYAVALDGERALIGSETWGSNQGSAYVFERQPGGTWTQVAQLFASDGKGLDRFARSVALDGDRAVIGAPEGEAVGVPFSDDPGAAYVFERQPGGGWLQTARLESGDLEPEDDFGSAVAVDGDRLVVGARDEDSGGNNSGKAYVFEFDGSAGWTQSDVLLPLDTQSGDLFGVAVALASDRILVGARNEDTNGSNSGAAYTFDVEALSGSTSSLSLSAGGAQTWDIDAGQPFAFGFYLVLGSTSGTSPGFPLSGGLELPLVLDPYLDFTLNNANLAPLNNSFGVFNGAGFAQGGFALPAGSPAALAGTTLHHAFFGVSPQTFAIEVVSAPLALQLLP